MPVRGAQFDLVALRAMSVSSVIAGKNTRRNTIVPVESCVILEGS
jgi:hypothetical protein